MTKQSISNRVYCFAINDYFSPFKNHRAVILTRDMIPNQHFNYARPHKTALRLNEITNFENDELHTWANEVKCCEADAKFDLIFMKRAINRLLSITLKTYIEF